MSYDVSINVVVGDKIMTTPVILREDGTAEGSTGSIYKPFSDGSDRWYMFRPAEGDRAIDALDVMAMTTTGQRSVIAEATNDISQILQALTLRVERMECTFEVMADKIEKLAGNGDGQPDITSHGSDIQKLQFESRELQRRVDELQRLPVEVSNLAELAGYINLEALSYEINLNELCANVDLRDLAGEIDASDISDHISAEDIAGQISTEDIVEELDLSPADIASCVDLPDLSRTIAETIDFIDIIDTEEIIRDIGRRIINR